MSSNWPADIALEGIPRASRVPLGLAAKMLVKVGDVDIYGNVIKRGEGGWYYKWWRGLHCLMGEEGLDTGMFFQRPSHEGELCGGFTFKKDFKAVIQAPEGETAATFA